MKMSWLTRRLTWFTIMAAISLLSVSCSDRKTSQCQKIIRVANQTVNEAESLTAGGQSSDPQAMLRASDAMEQASLEMEAITVNDPQLQTYQQGFIDMYRNTSQATRDFVTAFEQKNRLAAEAALDSLQQATIPEQELVTGINDYCASEE